MVAMRDCRIEEALHEPGRGRPVSVRGMGTGCPRPYGVHGPNACPKEMEPLHEAVGLSCRSAEERMNMAVQQSAIAISSPAAQQRHPTTKVHGFNARSF
jgi:hypothetical protein